MATFRGQIQAVSAWSVSCSSLSYLIVKGEGSSGCEKTKRVQKSGAWSQLPLTWMLCDIVRDTDHESHTENPSTGFELPGCPQEKGVQHLQKGLWGLIGCF